MELVSTKMIHGRCSRVTEGVTCFPPMYVLLFTHSITFLIIGCLVLSVPYGHYSTITSMSTLRDRSSQTMTKASSPIHVSCVLEVSGLIRMQQSLKRIVMTSSLLLLRATTKDCFTISDTVELMVAFVAGRRTYVCAYVLLPRVVSGITRLLVSTCARLNWYPVTVCLHTSIPRRRS